MGSLSTNPKVSVRNAVKSPSFILDTDIFDKSLNKIPNFDHIYKYIIDNELLNVVVEFALFNKDVGIKKERIIIYELRTHY